MTTKDGPVFDRVDGAYRERPGAYVVIVRDGLVACVRTKSLLIPGGGIDPGEDVHVAAAREVREETGLGVVNLRPVGRAVQFVVNADGSHVAKICDYFTGDAAGEPGVPTEPDHTLEWLPVEVALAGLALPADRWALAKATGRG